MVYIDHYITNKTAVSAFRIYHFSGCPFSRTLRMSLKEKNLQFELIHEKPWEHKDEFFKINPAGTTPVLVLENDVLIRGIYSGIEYLEEIDAQPKLLVGDHENRAHIRYVFHWFTEKFYSEVTKYILCEKIIRILAIDGSPNSSAIRAAKKNITYHLDYIAYLLSNNTYLCGERITIADCAAAAQLSVLDLVGDVPWEHNTKVKTWYSLMKSRPSLSAILKDEIHGITPPKHYADPDF